MLDPHFRIMRDDLDVRYRRGFVFLFLRLVDSSSDLYLYHMYINIKDVFILSYIEYL